MKTKSLNLTVYLIKAEFAEDYAFIVKRESLETCVIQFGDDVVGELFIKQSEPHLPQWARIFKGSEDFKKVELKTSSASAILVVEVDDLTFVLTFGHGRHLLVLGSWEERFGLLVSLNSISTKVRSIDKKTFDALSRHSREQSSREVSANEFGINVEQDLLRAVAGTPDDKALGNKMTGMDGLNVSAKVDLVQVPALLGKYHGKFKETTYKKNYPWVDQIAELKDRRKIAELDGILVDRLRQKNADRLWLAVPEIIDWTDARGFAFSSKEDTETENDILLGKFLDSVTNPSDLRIDDLKSKKVFCLSNTGEYPLYHWPVYECVYFELDDRDNTYLLNGAKWYRVSLNFVQGVNEFFSKIPICSLPFPDYADGTEAQYNSRVCQANTDFALMDAKPIFHGGGHGQVEFCDMFSKSGHIVHVKRYGGSNVLSHLFSQGMVSAELFCTDVDFREKLNDKLPEGHKIPDFRKSPDCRDYEIVFGIVSKSGLSFTLPFFSRITLRQTVRRLTGFGYKVSLKKIEEKQ